MFVIHVISGGAPSFILVRTIDPRAAFIGKFIARTAVLPVYEWKDASFLLLTRTTNRHTRLRRMGDRGAAICGIFTDGAILRLVT